MHQHSSALDVLVIKKVTFVDLEGSHIEIGTDILSLLILKIVSEMFDAAIVVHPESAGDGEHWSYLHVAVWIFFYLSQATSSAAVASPM